MIVANSRREKTIPSPKEVAWGVSGMRELKVIGFGHWLDVNSPSLEEALVHSFSLNLQVI